jgi:catechol 2,3-dioxygenase-like lactoylglutathione lyase family enzyme
MTPRQDGRPVLCEPLAGITLASDDLAQCRRFYGDALDLRADTVRWSGEAAQQLARHWGIASRDDLDVLLLSRPGLPEAIQLRIVGVAERPTSRPGLDCRFDGPQGGMKLAKGIRIRFQQWFAPGSRTGYLVIMQLLSGSLRAPNGLGLKNCGIGLWSFPTSKFEEVEDRVMRHGTTVLSSPIELDLPGAGRRRSMVIATPDGFPVEIFRC